MKVPVTKREKQYMFEVTAFGRERVPIVENGETEDEAREAAKRWKKRGERIGPVLEINGAMTDYALEQLKQSYELDEGKDKQ